MCTPVHQYRVWAHVSCNRLVCCSPSEYADRIHRPPPPSMHGSGGRGTLARPSVPYRGQQGVLSSRCVCGAVLLRTIRPIRTVGTRAPQVSTSDICIMIRSFFSIESALQSKNLTKRCGVLCFPKRKWCQKKENPSLPAHSVEAHACSQAVGSNWGSP